MKVLPALILFLSLFFSLFSSLSAGLDSKDRPKVLLAEVKLVKDQKKILVPAKVGAKMQSLVTADTEGHVTQILKSLGSNVRAGENILFLENKDPSFTYAKVPVKAPISGVLGQLLVSQMSKISRGDKLFTVINPHSLKIEVEFAGLDAGLMKPGMEGVFQEGNNSYKVKVVGISPLLDSRTGTASAELEFLPNKNHPAIGSLGQASFDIPLGQVILVPENSLFYQDGKPLVRVLKGRNQVEKKTVELGEQREDLFVVKSGLLTGEKIVLRSSRPIKDGEDIDVENTDSAEKK